MGFDIGDDDINDFEEELVEKQPEEKNPEVPTETNPIENEIILAPEVKEHEVLSKEMVQNKRPWFDDLTNDMYKESITEINGSRIHVDYFNMMTADDSISSGTSKLISSVHREYLNIKDYPIFLDGELDTNTSAREQKTDTQSVAIISGVLPPQTGDYFAYSTGINRESVFKVTRVKPLSIYSDRAYEIGYQMEEAVKGELYVDLCNKTTRRLNYMRESHQMGTKYLLTDEEVLNELNDKMLGDTLFRQYVSEYYHQDLKVFAVKTSRGWHADMIIQNFLAKIEKCPSDMYTYPEYEQTETLQTVFDVIMYCDKGMMMNVMNKVYYYHLYGGTDIGHIHPVLASPITSMPFQKSSRMMDIRKPNVVESVIHQAGASVLSELTIDSIFDDAYLSEIREFPNVLQNETYLLSEHFYSGSSGNLMEELIVDAINRRPVDRLKLMKLVGSLPNLEHEERFFITPFIIALIKLMRG